MLKGIMESVKNIKIEDIETAETFSGIFHIRSEVLEAITEDMKKNGYDKALPVIIWKEKNILIDGHTRLQAARNAGVKEIPAVYTSFDTDDDVMDYIHRIQFSRRNIDDADLIKLIINALPQYEKKYGEGSKAEFLSKRYTGLSVAKAKQTIVVIEKGGKEYIEAVMTGKATIKAAYDKMRDCGQSPKKQKLDNIPVPTHGIVSYDDKGTFYITDEETGQRFKMMKLNKELNLPGIMEKIKAIIQEEMNNKIQ